MKLDRKFKLFIESTDGVTIEIPSPFSLEFDVQRNTYGAPNTFSYRIYNLSEKNRNRIRKDSWDILDRRRVELRAGYGQNLKTLAVGTIRSCQSYREGTNFITEIEGFDGGLAYIEGKTNLTFQSGAQKRTVLRSLMQNLNKQGVSFGALGNIEGSLGRGNSFSGNTVDIIKDVSGGFFFIDNEKSYVLKDNEALLTDVFIINSATGLLSTPRREETYLTFDMLFEPSLRVGALVELRSSTNKNFNGIHKVQKVIHKGLISESVGGTATTTVGLLDGQYNPISSVA